MPTMASIQFGQRIRVQRLGLQFLQLMLQPGLALGGITKGEQRIVFVAQGPPLQGGAAGGIKQSRMACMRIQQISLRGACEQRLLLVLTMDFHQQCRHVGELRDGGRAAVDPGFGATIGAKHPAQLACGHRRIIGVVEFRFLQPRCCGWRIGQREFGREFGPFRAMPDAAGIGSGPAQEAQRIDQQRLARAGFARNHGQPGPERQFGVGDHGKITDCESGEHRRALCLQQRQSR